MTQLPDNTTSWRDWIVPLDVKEVTLKQIIDSAAHIMAGQDDIPLVIQLIENPKFDIPVIDLFNGAVDIQAHDCIHALLGRGLLPKDEAFVIGFTMGSTNRVSQTEEKLFSLAAKYLYPGPYKFNDEEIQIFKDAVRLGYISDCQRLDKVDYKKYMDWDIDRLRDELGIEKNLLKAYYEIEINRHPDSKTSQRLFG
jgi:hypothetical protein